MDGRHEYKFYINEADRAMLRARLRVLAKPDPHSTKAAPGADPAAFPGYTVRSLYFDNYADKAVMEKLSGLSRREKFRFRFYNGDASFIRLEKKSKINRLCYKESAAADAEKCGALLTGDYDWLRTQENGLFTELYAKMRFQNLRPRCVVEYHREAYIYRAGNVRVTFDSGIKATDNVSGFLRQGAPSVPAAGAIVLELKYDGFLPDIIRDAINFTGGNQTEFSKYAAARLI